MSTPECTFCKVVRQQENMVHESEYFFVFLDIYPVTPGHTLIIPKRHVRRIPELSSEEWVELQEVFVDSMKIIESKNLLESYQQLLAHPMYADWNTRFVELAIVSPLIHEKPRGYNFGVNTGIAAGQTISHLHWHLIPRYEGDVENPVGGVRNVIPLSGNYRSL